MTKLFRCWWWVLHAFLINIQTLLMVHGSWLMVCVVVASQFIYCVDIPRNPWNILETMYINRFVCSTAWRSGIEHGAKELSSKRSQKKLRNTNMKIFTCSKLLINNVHRQKLRKLGPENEMNHHCINWRNDTMSFEWFRKEGTFAVFISWVPNRYLQIGIYECDSQIKIKENNFDIHVFFN